MLHMLRVLTCIFICAGFALSGCTRDQTPEVVLYTSADEYVARQVVTAFEKDTGIRVRLLGDTEAKKATGLVERLRAEHQAERPQADVYWSSEIFMTIALAEEGVLEPFTAKTIADWPEQFRDVENRWYEFAARARVIVYAPQRMDEADLPRSWIDLTDEKYRGRIVMADPRFGTTGGHLGAMKTYWQSQGEPERYDEFIAGLARNETRLLASGNAGVVRAVAGGEADLGMTDTDDVWAAQEQGLNVELIYPYHGDAGTEHAGTLLIPNTVSRVAGGPNPETAATLIEYLLSEKVERMLAESASGNIPLRPGLREQYERLAVPHPLDVDLAAASAARREAIEQAMHALE